MGDLRSIDTAWACQEALAKLFYYLDERRYGDLVALFDPDGVWYRQGKVLKGGTAIMAAMEARSPTYTIRHSLTNFLVIGGAGGVVEAVAYVTAYAADSGRPPEPPVTIPAPLGVFVARASFRPVASGVALTQLDLKQEFAFPRA